MHECVENMHWNSPVIGQLKKKLLKKSTNQHATNVIPDLVTQAVQGKGWILQGELTEKGSVFSPEFHLRCLFIHENITETGWCLGLCNLMLSAQAKIEGIFQKFGAIAEYSPHSLVLQKTALS